jgi:3',5'-cyclic AMP phosphodiesterase CpdA
VAVRLLHISDLHTGAHDDGRAEVERELARLVESLEPELVVASGDLTHRNHAEQHARAAAFLRSLGPPVLAVPGNHDVPMLPPARLVRTFRAFERLWGTAEPRYLSQQVAVCGLNSVTPWLYQEGHVDRDQLTRAGEFFASATPGALRAAVLHHHLVSAPWRTAKRPLLRRSRVLAALAAAGADVILSGHVHQSVVVERREFAVPTGPLPTTVVVTAPGIGRPRPSRHGEASGFQVVDAEDGELRVQTFTWDRGAFIPVAERRFPVREQIQAAGSTPSTRAG